MQILYTKNNCHACEKVKDYLKIRDLDIQIVNISELDKDKQTQTLSWLQQYSQTFPTLVTVLPVSDNIIEHLAILPDKPKPAVKNPEYFWGV